MIVFNFYVSGHLFATNSIESLYFSLPSAPFSGKCPADVRLHSIDHFTHWHSARAFSVSANSLNSLNSWVWRCGHVLATTTDSSHRSPAAADQCYWLAREDIHCGGQWLSIVLLSRLSSTNDHCPRHSLHTYSHTCQSFAFFSLITGYRRRTAHTLTHSHWRHCHCKVSMGHSVSALWLKCILITCERANYHIVHHKSGALVAASTCGNCCIECTHFFNYLIS